MGKPSKLALSPMEVDQKHFNAFTTLAEINVEINRGRATLLDLEQKKDEFLEAREKEATERVAQVLEASKDALDQANKNYDQLSKYKHELTRFADSLGDAYTGFESFVNNFATYVRAARKEIDEEYEKLAAITLQHKQEKEIIEADRKALKRKEEGLDAKQKHIESQAQSLASAFEELRKLRK